jgi:hypothetical protein
MALGVLAATSIRRNRSPSTWMARWNRQREVRLKRSASEAPHLSTTLFSLCALASSLPKAPSAPIRASGDLVEGYFEFSKAFAISAGKD